MSFIYRALSVVLTLELSGARFLRVRLDDGLGVAKQCSTCCGYTNRDDEQCKKPNAQCTSVPEHEKGPKQRGKRGSRPQPGWNPG